MSDRPTYSIPFNRPMLVGTELDYVADAFARGKVSGDGHYTHLCNDLLQQIVGSPRALLTTSCTHALEMAAILLEIGPGDEVIVPSFTFVSTVNAFVTRGATPVFCDVREDTLNMDERLLESLITERTKAIVPVHYAGVACEMDTILDIGRRHGVPVVEDNAHGLCGAYKGRPLGSLGVLATQSFHETKNFSCGEGGALLINDAKFTQRAEIIREKGTNRSRFFRGEIDKYTWVDLGSSYLPSDILAAMLYAQLEVRTRVQARRRHIWNRYAEALTDWASDVGAKLPTIPNEVEQAYHLFYVLMPSLEARTQLIAHLKSKGILAVFHYLPLHLSDMGLRYGGALGDCPVTESVADRLVRLPLFFDLTDSEQSRVISEVHAL